jgi:hypothetical protein
MRPPTNNWRQRRVNMDFCENCSVHHKTQNEAINGNTHLDISQQWLQWQWKFVMQLLHNNEASHGCLDYHSTDFNDFSSRSLSTLRIAWWWFVITVTGQVLQLFCDFCMVSRLLDTFFPYSIQDNIKVTTVSEWVITVSNCYLTQREQFTSHIKASTIYP